MVTCGFAVACFWAGFPGFEDPMRRGLRPEKPHCNSKLFQIILPCFCGCLISISITVQVIASKCICFVIIGIASRCKIEDSGAQRIPNGRIDESGACLIPFIICNLFILSIDTLIASLMFSSSARIYVSSLAIFMAHILKPIRSLM